MSLLAAELPPTYRPAELVPEVGRLHARILRLALGVEDARAYWGHVDPARPTRAQALEAFEQRWFGGKSLYRVRFLLAALSERFEPFPGALTVLHGWHGMDLATRRALCHWHLQLSDPLYRSFTGEYLPGRRQLPDARVDRPATLRWVRSRNPGAWSEATCVQYASKLLSSASEAGLVSPRRDPRSLLVPRIGDTALGYLLHLLRSIRFTGTMTANPYLASVGLGGAVVEHRLRTLPGITFRRMGDLTELDWAARDLLAWAEVTL